MKMDKRVCYYSERDLTIGMNQAMADEAIAEYAKVPPSDINDHIELYHIVKLLNVRSSNDKLTNYKVNGTKNIIKDYNALIVSFFKNIRPEMALSEYTKTDWRYKQTFWDIIEHFGIFDILTDKDCKTLLTQNPSVLEDILHNQKLTNKLNNPIKEFIFEYNKSAEILVEKHLTIRDKHIDREIFIPKNISITEKEEIVTKYLDSEIANLNYVRLIEHAADIKNEFTLSHATKLKAKRLAKKLNDQILTSNSSNIIDSSIAISFSYEDDIQPVSWEMEGLKTFIKYSAKHIEASDCTDRLKFCMAAFGIMNNQCLVELISKRHQVTPFEKACRFSNDKMYPSFENFKYKNDVSTLSLYICNNVLEKSSKSIESDLKKYYEEYLRDVFGYPSVSLSIPVSQDSYLNKCRVLLPEIDSIVKQYNIYVEEDEIDEDYLQLQKPVKIADAMSLFENRYYELGEDKTELGRILLDVFTYRAYLGYVKPHIDKNYDNLYELLNAENVEYRYYEEYQQVEIDYLVKQRILIVSEDGCVHFTNNDTAQILHSLWEYNACSYWHFNDNGRAILDTMYSNGWLRKSDKLLTSEEQKLFSYFLDNSLYTNGPALRNHYMHGSRSTVNDEKTHMEAYYRILGLLSVIIFKIDCDLRLACRAITETAKNPL